ncbi:unnamed protein product [Moneuplotes crassus]|uniref:Uncharacterized protein n=1 Tax=Euplotes crassus TaxID=5936 RepID=A0AAD1XMG9_EUPCR|nr:unnamed protein product [Moneuplotes crassus]
MEFQVNSQLEGDHSEEIDIQVNTYGEGEIDLTYEGEGDLEYQIQGLEQEVEDLRYELKRDDETKDLIDKHNELRKILDQIKPERYIDEDAQIESLEIKDQISMLKVEETMWENRILKIQTNPSFSYDKEKVNPEVISSVGDTLNRRLASSTSAYKDQIEDLQRKVRTKETEINDKFIIYQRLQRELAELETQYSEQKSHLDNALFEKQQEIEKLKDRERGLQAQIQKKQENIAGCKLF